MKTLTRMVILPAILVFLASLAGCIGSNYTVRYKYAAPIPSKNFYELNNIQINIIYSEDEFQALVKEKFGAKDEECVGFTDYKNGKTIVYLLANPDGSIELDFLAHEIFYHHMEKEKGH